jgi:hypothetical protein
MTPSSEQGPLRHLAEAHATSYQARVQVHLIDASLYRSGVVLLYPGHIGEADLVNQREP